MKVSFDFDGTLDREVIQKYAKELISRGHEVWLHTLRINNPTDYSNDDVFIIADKVGIPKERIVFCNMTDKWNFLKDKDFLWHLDDDWIECNLINANLETFGISCYGTSNWKNKCERLLNES